MKSKLVALAVAVMGAASAIFPIQVVGQSATPAAAVPPVLGTPFYQGVPEGASIPRVVPDLCVPKPLSENVRSSIREIRITFDQAMDTALFYWPMPTNDPYFPFVRDEPYWTNGNRTVVLPVQLSGNRVYSIPINSPTMVFRGATCLYANPGLFRFATNDSAGGVAPASALDRNPNNRFRNNFGPAVPTAVPVATPLIGGPTGGTGTNGTQQNLGTGATGPQMGTTGGGRPGTGSAFRRPSAAGVGTSANAPAALRGGTAVSPTATPNTLGVRR